MNTRHRYGCAQPGWAIARAKSPRGWLIARCLGCDTVELRRRDPDPLDPAPPPGPHGSADVSALGDTDPVGGLGASAGERRMGGPFRPSGTAVACGSTRAAITSLRLGAGA